MPETTITVATDAGSRIVPGDVIRVGHGASIEFFRVLTVKGSHIYVTPTWRTRLKRWLADRRRALRFGIKRVRDAWAVLTGNAIADYDDEEAERT